MSEANERRESRSGSSPLLSGLDGLAVQVSPFMEGQKRAVQINETVYVSPAMYDLMKHADQ